MGARVSLKEILRGVPFTTPDDITDVTVKGVTVDSRAIKRGDLFVAVKGAASDGHDFIDEAIRKGARAVVSEEDFGPEASVKRLFVPDSRSALSVIAGNFYSHPSDKLKLIGVTGTNGKTTITYILESILEKAGEKVGVIGTVNYRFAGSEKPAGNTTPGPLELERLLADMVKAGVRYAVMEVSSHALDQGRVDGLRFDAAVFANMTREHLDYHKTVDNYFAAKAKIFDKLKDGAIAVLNNDDPKVAKLSSSIGWGVVTYGIDTTADVMAKHIRISLEDSRFKAIGPGFSMDIKTRLIGRHNISNILAAIAVSHALGLSEDAVKSGIESFSLVPGRLESIDEGQPFKVFVDFAHTDDALSNVLALLKGVAKGNIITVFGCGGNRDRNKRPLMGQAACKHSDSVIITSDNPRSEDPASIIDEIERGVKGTFSNYRVVVDRRTAIEEALGLASTGDIVVIAGKGHERYQILKEKTVPFDDCEAARSILKRLAGSAKGRRATEVLQ